MVEDDAGSWVGYYDSKHIIDGLHKVIAKLEKQLELAKRGRVR